MTIQIRCLLPVDAPTWEDILLLFLEIGCHTSTGEIVWKNAGAIQTGDQEFSQAFLPVIWSRHTATAVFRFDCLHHPARFADRAPPICLFRQQITLVDGQVLQRTGEVNGQYSDDYINIQIAKNQ